MENDVKIIGKFYMKNGAIIEEEIVLDKDNEKEAVEELIKDIQFTVKEGFRKDYDFQLTFGYTTFRGRDISAVTFTTA